MSKPGRTGIARMIHATRYSWYGLRAAWQYEAAFRQELVLVVLLAPLSYLLAADLAEMALLLMTLFIVLLAELFNSAIEAVVDRVGDEPHQLSGRAKDIGSAAVMLALLLAGLVWGLLLLKNVGG